MLARPDFIRQQYAGKAGRAGLACRQIRKLTCPRPILTITMLMFAGLAASAALAALMGFGETIAAFLVIRFLAGLASAFVMPTKFR